MSAAPPLAPRALYQEVAERLRQQISTIVLRKPDVASWQYAIDPAWHVNLLMLVFVLAAVVAQRVSAARQWPVAAWP